jgi:hypothetical protein
VAPLITIVVLFPSSSGHGKSGHGKHSGDTDDTRDADARGHA